VRATCRRNEATSFAFNDQHDQIRFKYSCEQWSQELKKGDYLVFWVFSDNESVSSWMKLVIPIPGYTNL
jgi:hypothetical protein